MDTVQSNGKKPLFERLMTIDRRVIFLLVGLGLIVPFFLSVRQKIPVSPEVQLMAEPA